MKKNKLTIIIGIIGIILSVSFFSCTRKEMHVTVIVKDIMDTSKTISGAKITLWEEDIKVEGYSDFRGEFYHTFTLPMTLNVKAELDTTMTGLPPQKVGYDILVLRYDRKEYATTIFISTI